MRPVLRILWILVLLTTGLIQPVGADEHTLRYAGATTLQRSFMPDLAKIFYNDTTLRIHIDGGNTDPGLHALLNGEVDLAGAGRHLTAVEQEHGLVEHFLGWDALVIVVHQNNPVTDLTLSQLQGIYAGEIRNWQEVGGPDQRILVVSSPEGSGMRNAVQNLLLQEKSHTKNEIVTAIVANADQQVALFPMAITILSQSMFDAKGAKTLLVNGKEPTVGNIKAGAYPLVKPLALVTRGKPEGNLARLIELALSDRGKAVLNKTFVANE